MAKDFKIVGTDDIETKLCTIASATVIEAGDIVAMTSGLIVKAGAGSAAIAYAPEANADGETEIAVTVGNDFLLSGTGDAVFAVTQKGSEVDIVGTTTLLIDVGTSSTDVFLIDISETAGTVDSSDDIKVKINKPLF